MPTSIGEDQMPLTSFIELISFPLLMSKTCWAATLALWFKAIARYLIWRMRLQGALHSPAKRNTARAYTCFTNWKGCLQLAPDMCAWNAALPGGFMPAANNTVLVVDCHQTCFDSLFICGRSLYESISYMGMYGNEHGNFKRKRVENAFELKQWGKQNDKKEIPERMSFQWLAMSSLT